MCEWIGVKDKMPDKKEPIVYIRKKLGQPGKWDVGIGYWTVSKKWNPEQELECCPGGFTHWMPLPEPPKETS